ncbi:starch synthase 3 [Actinidia rufa]|uniref:starch synthase n=1 Tax=Actinidia rufa TaxID=165716 RepID=A0A7J0HES0_9ERIC|nr:starch synthase 3 [Actinidia rufa]
MNSEQPVDIAKDSDLLHVVHVTAEMAPIAKVGGLGDVVTGLARACLSRGHKVDVMLPFYECIQKQQINDLALLTTYNSFHDGNWVPTNAYRGLVSGIPVIFIEPSNLFFKGQYVYGGSYNELEAYLFFSRACLEWMQVTGIQPDIIHIHEWQTSGLPILYWDMYHYLSLQKPRLVITIHNIEHYGECSQEQLNKCGLDGSIYATVDKAVDDRTIGHNPERLCLLKGGIVYSNAVVSKCGSFWAQSNSTVINQKQQTRVGHLYCFWTLQSILIGGVTFERLASFCKAQKITSMARTVGWRGLGLEASPGRAMAPSLVRRVRVLVHRVGQMTEELVLVLERWKTPPLRELVEEIGGGFGVWSCVHCSAFLLSLSLWCFGCAVKVEGKKCAGFEVGKEGLRAIE